MTKKVLFILALLFVLPLYNADAGSGNAYTEGSFDLRKSTHYVAKLGYKPVRVKAAVENGIPVVYSLAEGGKVYKTSVKGGKTETALTSMVRSPHSKIYTGRVPDDASPLSAPVMTDYCLLYIDKYGNFIAGEKKYDVNATDDNVIAVSGRYAAVLTDPTTKYNHGALGDYIESGGFAVIDLEAEKVISRTSVEFLGVIEQTGALIADIDGDYQPEIVLTISNDRDGAGVYAFTADGRLKYSGNPVGGGHRWRHVLAAARFDDGVVRIADVVTPHIGGTLEFLEAVNGRLIKKSSIGGVSSHNFGSADLGMGLAVDTDGDSVAEMLVPSQDKTRINAYRNNCEIIELADIINFRGELSTEIEAYAESGRVRLLTFGTTDGELHIYAAD